jgi:hypothetical protein
MQKKYLGYLLNLLKKLKLMDENIIFFENNIFLSIEVVININEDTLLTK